MRASASMLTLAFTSVRAADMGFCGVASGTPSVNEAEWGPIFANANINWFWNWETEVKSDQYVPAGWKFVPNLWGPGGYALKPGTARHRGPGASSYEIVDIVLGWNEPDMVGLCISEPEIATPDDGWCQVAGSMGWWFPEVVTDPTAKMADWYDQHDDSRSKGYSVATPQVAVDTGSGWLGPFVDASCSAGRCPQYISWHFYSMGCHSEDSYLEGFAQKLDDSLALMQKYSGIQGVLITEAGTLALELDGSQAAATCSDEVLTTVMQKMFTIMRRSKYYLNGKNIVSHFSWFSQDGTGATYNLSLVDPDSGAMRPLGKTYAQECGQMMSSSIVV
jgi:hypothetical protein